jgi:outer membrane protein OmpA-like peptidoglycan-associated protein
MKKTINISLSIFLSVILLSCTAIQNANKTQKGAGLGVAAGAILGGIIGGDIKGALIGAGIGGAAGGVVGNVMDKQADKISEAIPGADVERVGEGIHVTFDENSGVNFATNKSELTSKAKLNLDKIVNVFNEFPDTNLFIQGHTDDTGKAEYNMSLSKKRSQSVADYFTSRGISSNRFSVEGFGETQPRYDNTTPEGRSQNRRVEIAISANKDMIEDAQAKVRQN